MTFDPDKATVLTTVAPLLAPALARIEHPGTIRFAFTRTGVIVSSTTADGLDRAGPVLIAAFTEAGWGFGSSHDVDGNRIRISFQAPWTLTRAGHPTAR